MAEQGAAVLLAEDLDARERALDPERSYLVQAPAGSGKTELLIQRYLALLARVEAPERIVALTFTRKAAGEMRERVIEALATARAGTAVTKPHEVRTRQLALAALAQDARCGWSLMDHPSRFALHTFDALSAAIARRAPLTAKLGPVARFVDDASELYAEAARAALGGAAADQPHWRRLLAHVDNDADYAITLLAGLLARRDQWLRQVRDETPESLRRGLEGALRAEIGAALDRVRAAFPPHAGDEIVRLAAIAARELRALGDDDLAQRLEACASCSGLPATDADALAQWNTLARWLLVGAGTHFRKSLSRNDGFPAGKPDADARKAAKAAMAGLCEELNAQPGLASLLASAGRLPPPAIDDVAWDVVEALLVVLRDAAAHLTVAFAARGEVDFVQGQIAARDALGTGEAPTDLLLRLDARIDHLLLDEFQDTSFAQLEFLQQLTSGWQGETGRTLFAVGDPMQSIYRFREAEVQLFVRAQHARSIAGLPVECLTLRRNFRSQPNLVAFVNDVFPEVLGHVDNPALGAVRFSEAVPTRDPLPGPAATLDVGSTAEEEAAAVVRRVEEALADRAHERADGRSPEKPRTIAILVRARAHLAAILPALRGAGIAFAAVDLDTLGERQAMRDLSALTYALVQPTDRTAWLAVLRAPWCGLTLADLLALVEAAGGRHDRPLLPWLARGVVVPGLSDDGRARLERVAPVLAGAAASRGRCRLVDRVRGAWLALGGPACLGDALDLETAESFFAVLAEHEHGGDLADRETFELALAAVRAAPAGAQAAPVQVMTMHRAKGLEFDTVILPGLARPGTRGDRSLLRWRRREGGLVLAPSKPRGGEASPVYRWLGEVLAAEEDAELGRLLYVACTRARARLHLVAFAGTRSDRDNGGSSWIVPKGSSLDRLGQQVAAMRPPAPEPLDEAPTAAADPPPLWRVEAGFAVPAPADPLPPPDRTTPEATEPLPFDWVAETSRQVGIIAHRLMARIAQEGPAAWTAQRLALLAPPVDAELARMGFDEAERPTVRARVMNVVERTLESDRGRWLFDRAHEEARSEWALAGVEGDAIVHVVIDRTFVADGVRWIVDFKTGSHEGGDPESFLASEEARYRPQLARYARLVRALDPARPIRLALYHPLVPGGFREWPHED